MRKHIKYFLLICLAASSSVAVGDDVDDFSLDVGGDEGADQTKASSGGK
jgi:hypothetical protein